MSLQFRFFTIPVKDTREAEEEMNRFLRSVRIITVQRELLMNGENSCWLVSAEYQTGTAETSGGKTAAAGKEKIDYREALSPEDFAIYARLREWRKRTAEKEGVQLYAVFTNKQMAAIAEKRIAAKNGLRELTGVGDARVQKYGDDVISIVTEEIAKLETPNPETPKAGSAENETGEQSVLFHTNPGKPGKGLPQGGPGKAP